MTRPPRDIRVDPSHVVNTGRIRRDINPGPNSMFPECPGANDDIAVFVLRDGNFPLRDSDGNTITAKRRLIAQPHPLEAEWLDVRMSCGGDTPMHSNSLTPMRILETPRSFLNFRIDSSYYGTVDMENLGYTARRSTTAAIRMRSWPGRCARRIAWYVACRSAPRSSRRWNNRTGSRRR
jgi:hypothetical protein